MCSELAGRSLRVMLPVVYLRGDCVLRAGWKELEGNAASGLPERRLCAQSWLVGV